MSENGDPYFKDRLARRLREELGAMMSDEGVPNDELRSYFVAAIAASYIGLLAHAATTNRGDSLGIDQIAFIANSMRVPISVPTIPPPPYPTVNCSAIRSLRFNLKIEMVISSSSS